MSAAEGPKTHFFYSGSGNFRVEITVTSVDPFAASIRYGQTIWKDYPQLGFAPPPVIPASLEKQAYSAMAGLCRQHGAEAEAGGWETRAQWVGLEDNVRRMLGNDRERDR